MLLPSSNEKNSEAVALELTDIKALPRAVGEEDTDPLPGVLELAEFNDVALELPAEDDAEDVAASKGAADEINSSISSLFDKLL